ncbi:MAG: septal ring lytic transglycosylase RlpA family protein [Gammaproteobacteria bacterium]|nr:septal ring lytic transglycosylase RlpA family protein [Gammaproteobacteria bacterium]
MGRPPCTVAWLPLLAVLLAACATRPSVPPATSPPTVETPPPAAGADGFPAPAQIPPNVAETPDAVPKPEPKSPYGNPDEYEALGKTYHVLDSAKGFTQRGDASWYGRKFQGHRTASGEPYDMFKMTAAHKTLPIPSYVRVTNLTNGRNAIVRINDRGPFHSGRIIDLSYAAAAKLGILGAGSAPVQITAITPGADTVKPAPGRYLQTGAFDDPVGAVAMREKLFALGISEIELTNDADGDKVLHRVLIGPFANETSLQSVRDQLVTAEIPATPVTR